MAPSSTGQAEFDEKRPAPLPPPNDVPSAESTTSTSSSSSSIDNSKKLSGLQLPASLQWIPKNWTWSNLKPVIRSAIVAWISAILFIIPKIELMMGQVSTPFLHISTDTSAAFLSPPSDPFISVLEREFLILFFVAIAWAWVSLGIFLANLARTNTTTAITFSQAITGDYLQAAPTVIIGVFVFFGSAFFLYIKARQGPGPYLFACVFACICIDISLTTAVLFPFPYYLVGQAIIVPLCLHSAMALLGSLVIFPTTISHQFTHRLELFLTPLISSLDLHSKILDAEIPSDEFTSLASQIQGAVDGSEGVLLSLAASVRLLNNDISWSRFAPNDFVAFQQFGRRLTGRANGMTVYFSLADPSRDPFPMTPAPSGANTPATAPSSPVASRPPSPGPLEGRPKFRVQTEDADSIEMTAAEHVVRSLERVRTTGSQTSSSPVVSTTTHHHHLHHHHQLHHSLLHLSFGKKRGEQAVGVFESQRYMNLEARKLHDPYADIYTQRMTHLLRDCCMDLLVATKDGLSGVREWLGTVRDGKFKLLFKSPAEATQRQNRLDATQRLRYQAASALEEFRNDKRLKVIDPYRPAFEKAEDNPDYVMPPHRYLFNCYVYQFHLIRFSEVVINMLDEVIRLEVERDKIKFWTPVKRLLTWSKYDVAEPVVNTEDDDPDVIQGVGPSTLEDLGMALQRDPDALPPRNAFEWLMSILYYAATGLAHGNVLFAIKAGLFTVVLCLPYFIKNSADFAYQNRFSWGIIMGQLTLARFRGDTTFGLTARVFSTFAGGVVGMVIWYISQGNPYGLAAVLGVCLPFFYYVRLYWPGPPMTNIVFFVTSILVVGYSYQGEHIVTPGNPGAGFSVAWKRFVLVTVGVAAAFIVSFLPPSTTIRRYQRRLLSTTCGELGSIYCAVISSANSRRESEVQEIITSLIAIRSKLKRSVVLRQNVIYELLLSWMSALTHFNFRLLAGSIDFFICLFLLMTDYGICLAMIATSLRTGNPLPQITPTPLIDRFMLRYHGLDIIHKESEEDYGLPRSLTLETLQNEQYLMFCVGVSTAFNIVNKLDRLMIAAKDIVGEQYHIHGVGLTSSPRIGVELGPRTSAIQLRPPKDV
ncbi:hypothetical protein AN958_05700 [Leucoagaricus sp. SymC.cos]|nr:hypothetical protein AN958_05700 [Leucoagaricus sp. SymC.cos]